MGEEKEGAGRTVCSRSIKLSVRGWWMKDGGGL